MMAGFRCKRLTMDSKWFATWPTVLSANTSGCAFASVDGLGIVRPTGVDRDVARALEQLDPSIPTVRQQPESVHEDDRKKSRALARSSCRDS